MAVLDRVESVLKSSKSETAVSSFSVFSENIDLLQDFTAVAIAGERISSEAGRDVQVHFLEKVVTENRNHLQGRRS